MIELFYEEIPEALNDSDLSVLGHQPKSKKSGKFLSLGDLKKFRTISEVEESIKDIVIGLETRTKSLTLKWIKKEIDFELDDHDRKWLDFIYDLRNCIAHQDGVVTKEVLKSHKLLKDNDGPTEITKAEFQEGDRIDIDDAIFLAKKYKIEYRIIKINNINSEYMKNLVYEKITQGNLFARIRMNILYYHANLMNRLVIGTGDKSEYLLGYFTKFGDGGADICPIGDLFKTQVRILGKLLDLPENILIKKSGPKLWKDHIAEEEIGNTYEEIDKFLFQIEKSNNLTNIESMNKSNVRINKILQLIQKNKHKLAMPEICKIN